MVDDLWHDLFDATRHNPWLLLLHNGLLRHHLLTIIGLDLLAEVKAVILLSWLDRHSNLALLFEECTHPTLLFADEGHLVQLLSPCLSDLDGVGLDLVVVG